LVVAGALSAVVACGGSSDPSEDAPDTGALLNDVCRKAREAPCGSAAAEQECLERFGRERDDAISEGCVAELNDYLKCASATAVRCSAIEGEPLEPHVGTSCVDKSDVLRECIMGLLFECGVVFSPGTDSVFCSVFCNDLISMCTGPSQSGPLECTCRTGPKDGVTFQATDCSRGIVMATGHTCR